MKRAIDGFRHAAVSFPGVNAILLNVHYINTIDPESTTMEQSQENGNGTPDLMPIQEEPETPSFPR